MTSVCFFGGEAKVGAKVVRRKATLAIACAEVLVAAKWPQPCCPPCLCQTCGESKLLPECEISNLFSVPLTPLPGETCQPSETSLGSAFQLCHPRLPFPHLEQPSSDNASQGEKHKILHVLPRFESALPTAVSPGEQNYHNLTSTARCIFTSTCLLIHKYLAAHTFAKIILKQHSFPGETRKIQTACDRC